jgi:hypothetical protein
MANCHKDGGIRSTPVRTEPSPVPAAAVWGLWLGGCDLWLCARCTGCRNLRMRAA